MMQETYRGAARESTKHVCPHYDYDWSSLMSRLWCRDTHAHTHMVHRHVHKHSSRVKLLSDTSFPVSTYRLLERHIVSRVKCDTINSIMNVIINNFVKIDKNITVLNLQQNKIVRSDLCQRHLWLTSSVSTGVNHGKSSQ